jgi:hypothetical protein
MTNPYQEAPMARLHDLIRTMLPQPIRTEDGLLVGGDPGEVVVRISDDKVAVAAYAVLWDCQEPRLAPEGWKTFPMTAKPERVAKAIIKARARRIATFEWCPRCQLVNPPEWMSDGTCQGCAEKVGVKF